MRGFLIITLLANALFFTSCEKELPYEPIPYTIVNEDINLTNLQYLNLSNLGGYVYYNAGYRGLIIFHEGGGFYKAFERACSHDPRSECTPVEMDESTLFMKHDCCGSTFSLDGNPTSGPASLNLLRYDVYVDGNYLKIRNNN